VTKKEDDDMREAAFRYMFAHNVSAMQQVANVFCLHVEGGADPSPELLARFTGAKIPVHAGSACTSSPSQGVALSKTGAKGLAFASTT
jgi:hypothetical protein